VLAVVGNRTNRKRSEIKALKSGREPAILLTVGSFLFYLVGSFLFTFVASVDSD
jgi:hypothetical protein